MNKTLEIRDIEIDPALQPRAAMDQATLDDYTEVLTDDQRVDPWPFPPVGVVFDGQKYWLWDGFHRVQAAQNAGILRIPATVQEGDRAFALWRSLGANKTHGLRRTNADKRRATEQALLAAPTRSDREISYHVGVSPTTVGTIRKELTLTVQIGQSTTRTGADGRTINTANIGSQAAYVSIWELEQGVRTWLEPSGLNTQIALLEAIKNKIGSGPASLELLLSASTPLPGPRRKGDVIQACHNVLNQLNIKKWREDRAERIKAMTCLCGQTTLEPVGEMDALKCSSCGRSWNSLASLKEAAEQPSSPLSSEERGPGGEVESPAPNNFDCPICFDEKVVHTNGGAWCLACGVKWASVASFKLDLENYRKQQAHARNLRELVEASGGPETAAHVLELKEKEALAVEIYQMIRRIVEAESLLGLKELITTLEDFELDRPPEALIR